ncbi:MAG: SdrD B-like domain-containing protein [Steroidobacteraceae bacterium]
MSLVRGFALFVGLLGTAALAQADPVVKLLTFQDSPDPVPSTTTLTYQLQVSNTDFAASAANVQLTVPIPTGASFVSVSDAACSYIAPNVVCSFGTLPASIDKFVTINMTVTDAAGNTLSSTAIASATGETDSTLTQTTSITAGGDLALTMTATPATVTAGGQVTYTLGATNNGPDTSSGLTLTDTLPPNVAYQSASGPGWSCSNSSGTVTCTLGGTLASGASSTVTLVGTVQNSSSGTITNSATLSATTPDGNPNNNTATASVAVSPGADLSISKTASPNAMIAANPASFTLAPRNTGPDAASTVTVSDTLPTGFKSISASGTNWSCSVVQATRVVTCTRATTPSGASDDITIAATAPDNTVVPSGGMSSSNTAAISSGVTNDPVSSNNSGSVTFTIQRDGADMSISKTKSPNPVAQNSPLTSVLRTTNNGPRALGAGDTITITDTLGTGENYTGAASFTSNGWTCSYAAPIFSCTLPGPLAVGATTPAISLVTTATSTSALTNQGCVTIAGTYADPNAANNCTSATSTSTLQRADLVIVKAEDANPLTTSATTLTYTLTISNNGPDDSQNVVVRDTIPMYTALAGGTILSATANPGTKGSTGTCAISAASIQCDYGTLLFASGAPANTPETATISVAVRRPVADGSFTNTATVDSTSIGDQDRTNNSSSINVTVDPVADVRVQGKTVTPNPVLAGTDATYVITFDNQGPSAAQNVTLTDQFSPTPGDAGYTVRSMTPSKGSCSYTAASDLISCSIGTLSAGESETLTVVVRPKWMASPPAGRNLRNTATVSTTTAQSDSSNDSKLATLNISPASADLIANIADVPSFSGVPADPLGYDGTSPSSNLVTYLVTITNAGPSQATSVAFQNSYVPPSGRSVTFLCDSDSEYSCSGTPVCTATSAATVTGPTHQVVTCSAPDLETNTSYTRYLRYQIDTSPQATGDTYANSVAVTANETDANVSNNSATEPTAVRAKADLQLTSKTAVVSSPPLQYGQTFQWQIKVDNLGPGTGYSSTLSDSLPSGVELASPFTYSTTAGTCTNTGVTQFSCSLGDIPAATQVTVTVNTVIRAPTNPPYPTSYTNTASVSTFSVDLVSGNNSMSGSVSFVKSSIAGRIYSDRNNNGAIDGGESGIAGVTLTLVGTDAFGNSVSRSAISDAGGNYLFDNLEQAGGGGYTITETQPSAYSDGLETAGSASSGAPPGGTVSVTVGSNTISGILLDRDQVATGYNFGELKNNSLGGTVFADSNNNGIKNAGEPGISTATITLTGTDARGASVNRTTTTAASGAYSFTNVLPGTYQLNETQPATYLDGTDTVGNQGGANSLNDEFSGIALTDSNGTGYNFAELPGSISGKVWRDANRNGILDAGETGITGVIISLTGTDGLGGTVTHPTTTTDSNGNYSFTDLPAGTFTVTETLPAGYGAAPTNPLTGITIPAAGSSSGNNFGNPTARLAGGVFFDRNGNGVSDGTDSPIAAVTLALSGTSAANIAVSLTTITDASGNFSFDDILAPNATGYTLTETQPTAYANGAITAGTAGGTVTQPANRVSAISFTGGTVSGGYLFAELGTVISGTVYRDANRNGVKDSGDTGLGNVAITLKDAGNNLVATTTTAGDGTYSFPVQPGGSYTVVETQPTGYQSGPESSSNSVAVALLAGTPAAVNFGESAGALAGVVFLDSDSNGMQNAGEIGLPGVTLALSGTDANAAPVSATTTTSSSGAYSFVNLLAGTYTITETQPAAFGDGQEVLGPGNVGGTVANDVYSAISLPAGSQATGYNFAETGSAVTGVVFLDENRDGSQQPGDQGIAGVTTTLKDSGNNTVATATTASDGSYLFGGVAAGNYSVVETQPAGYGSAAPSPDSLAIVVPVAGAATAKFADTLSTLSGSVYADLNNNGTRDPGEPGIAGISVHLAGTDAAANTVSRNAATDANGNFLFIDILTPNAAGYTVSEPTQPAGYADGLDAAGTSGGTVGNDLVGSIHLPTNTDATGYLFGERGTTISGVVYKDVNANGTREGGEPGLPNVVMTLKNGLGAPIAGTMTAADGSYSFFGLPSGNYTVVETQPPGYGSSTPDSASATIAAGGSTSANFGETTSTIAGSVWSDTDSNAAREPGEPGIDGVTVTLTGTDTTGASVTRTTTTSAMGDFSFADLLSGTYTLTETQPAAYAQGVSIPGTTGGISVSSDVIKAIALPAGTQATGYLFSEKGQSITGHVWLDTNRNGSLESGEAGIGAVTVTLRDSSSTVVATTQADGSYYFANIPAGHYSVTETQPAGYGSSTPDAAVIDLVAGAPGSIVNFGDTAGSIAGLVYNDTNNNGLHDPGEPPIPGTAIELRGVDARGNAVTLTTTTGSDGAFRFANVVGGTYSIAETQPSGYADGLDTVGTADGTLGNDLISAIHLGPAVDATGYLFGEQGAAASITGTVWRDGNHDRVRGSDEAVLSDWLVELYQSSLLVQTATSDANGTYQFSSVPPGSGYEIKFREPSHSILYGAPVTNERGLAATPGVVGPTNPGGADVRGGTLAGLWLTPNERIGEQSLPVDPTGVIYDSVARQVIPGATVALSGPTGFDPATQLLGGAASAQQVTGPLGIYDFFLLANAPPGTYTIQVTPPPGRFTPGASVLIPACTGPLTVGSVPAPAVVQAITAPPAANAANQEPTSCPVSSMQLAAGEATTQYLYSFVFTPGSSASVVGNNIPVDPILGGALTVTKTTPMVNVYVGDLVPYIITVTNTLEARITNIDLRDLLPPGFAYRSGSAVLNGIRTEPQRLGRQLTWLNQSFVPHERKTFKLMLVVGAGVSEGEYINQAWAINNLVNMPVSNVATAAVRVVPDPVFDCSELIGKVFDDLNANGYQDQGEPGIAHVRIATVTGIVVTTDSEGRFHVACAAIPDEYRGSNFVMKLDERSLPSGYRITTENPRDVRITRGKMSKLNFGATIHRVIRVEVTDSAYEPDSIELKAEWRARIAQLPQSLDDKPSVVRVAYVLHGEDRKLAARRQAALVKQIKAQWEALHHRYPLQIEAEREVRP